MEAGQDTISGARILEILRAHRPLPQPHAQAGTELHFSLPREVGTSLPISNCADSSCAVRPLCACMHRTPAASWPCRGRAPTCSRPRTCQLLFSEASCVT